MLQRKRLLKKDKLKSQIKFIYLAIVAFLLLLIGIEFVLLNFSKISLISPLAKNKWSNQIYIEEQLKKDGISYSNVIASSDGSFVAKLVNGGEVILSSKKDIKSQLSSLQLIVSRLTIEGKRLRILDFRFDKPVVTF